MSTDLKLSARKVQNELYRKGVDCRVKEFSESTKTAKEAADAIGCEVEEIAKSIVFKGETSGRSILVIASGTIRVNEKKISNIVNEPIKKANAKFVREKLGYVIGGVPPVAHIEKPDIIIDETLSNYNQIWSAAGTPNSVFSLTFEQLKKITNGIVDSVV